MAIVYRITRLSRKNDLSGAGSTKFPGRWNRKGFPVIYCSESAAGASLEVLAYLGENYPIANPAVLLYIKIPQVKIEEINPGQLDGNWKRFPYPARTKKIGCDWLQSERSLALRVPSALAPETYNILLNPNHPLFKEVEIVKYHPISFDMRFFK